MRISDWSSDVCSSDLARTDRERRRDVHRRRADDLDRLSELARPERCHARQPETADDRRIGGAARDGRDLPEALWRASPADLGHDGNLPARRRRHTDAGARRARRRTGVRSEEHTSELPSLMRISYAVFFLTKKNK